MGHPAEVIKEATFEELYERIRNLPEGVTGEILVPNVLRTMGRPGKPHRRCARQILKSLDGFDANVGGTGWWIESEAELRLPGKRVVVPDLIGYRVERVPEVPDENPLTILPDWACEVFSPSNFLDDINIKLPLYAHCGIPWIWLVDPVNRYVQVYETIDGRPALTAIASDEERAVLPPFNGEFDVGPFWLPKPAEE